MPDHNLSINYILKLAFFLFGIINTDSGCGIFTYWDSMRAWQRAWVDDDECYYKACTAHMQGIVNCINYYYVL